MIEMAAVVRELCGIPAAIQKTFDGQRSEAKRKEARQRTIVDTLTMEGLARNE